MSSCMYALRHLVFSQMSFSNRNFENEEHVFPKINGIR